MLKKTTRPVNIMTIIALGAGFLLGCQAEKPTQDAPTLVQNTLPATELFLPPTPTSTDGPTLTPTATITPLPTATSTEVPTMTSSPTQTQEPASLTVNQDTVCRKGPATFYSIATYLSDGMTAKVMGSLEDATWWLVENEEVPEGSCWVSDVVASLEGDVESVMLMTPPPTPVIPATVTSEPKGIVYYMIATDTGGPIGCGDSLIPIYAGINYKPDMATNVKAALNALFSHHTKYVNGLYNPIYESNLKAKGLSYDASTGVARIQLRGTFVKPDDVCESKRMHAQVFYTVYQFEAIDFAAIFVNDALLGDLMEK